MQDHSLQQQCQVFAQNNTPLDSLSRAFSNSNCVCRYAGVTSAGWVNLAVDFTHKPERCSQREPLTVTSKQRTLLASSLAEETKTLWR